MTREQVEQCRKYEQIFLWAIRSNFVHLTASEFGEIAKLYKSILGKELTKSQMNCGTCRLNTIKTLGQDYLESRDKYIKEDRENEEEKEPEAPKKKSGRPKKIDIDAE